MGSNNSSRRASALFGLPLAFAMVLSLPMVGMAQGPGTEDGQWTYLGGDAWHTRYTPSDEITAENFANLDVAWQWNAASFGSDVVARLPHVSAEG